MRIVEITYSEGKTIQEEQFSPRNIHISAKAEVGEEDLHKSYGELKMIVKKELAIEEEKYLISKKSNSKHF